MLADPIYDREAERALLGGILGQNGTALESVHQLASGGLRAHHFHSPLHNDIFAAMLSLADHSTGVDPVTVVAEMTRLGRMAEDPREIHALPAVPSSGDVAAYAVIVKELAEWRHAKSVQLEITAAIEDQDRAALSQAVARMEAGAHERRKDRFSPKDMAEILYDFLASGEGTPDWVVPMPFVKLNTAMAGGLWPGELMLIGGHTNAGKSILGDQIMDFAADRGFQCHCYMTEMTALSRGLRYLTRRTGVQYGRLRSRTLTDTERKKVLAELERLNWGLTIAAGWTMEEVVSDALRARHQLVFIDLLHGFHYKDERELDSFVKQAKRLAEVSTTIPGFSGTAVMAGVHLQHNAPERPTHDHIKGSGSPKQDADTTMFIRLRKPGKDDVPGEPRGELYTTKARAQDKVSIDVVLNSRRFSFIPEDKDPETAAAAASQKGMPF